MLDACDAQLSQQTEAAAAAATELSKLQRQLDEAQELRERELRHHELECSNVHAEVPEVQQQLDALRLEKQALVHELHAQKQATAEEAHRAKCEADQNALAAHNKLSEMETKLATALQQQELSRQQKGALQHLEKDLKVAREQQQLMQQQQQSVQLKISHETPQSLSKFWSLSKCSCMKCIRRRRHWPESY